jgi:hypothetical protein
MHPRDDDRLVLIAVSIMVAFNGLYLSGNGIFMLLAPLAWYEAAADAAHIGTFNQHFIRNFGIVQLFVGIAFGIGLVQPKRRVGLWAAATWWLGVHAALHCWEVAVGIRSPAFILVDYPTVSLPAILGALLTFWAAHGGHVRRNHLRAAAPPSRRSGSPINLHGEVAEIRSSSARVVTVGDGYRGIQRKAPVAQVLIEAVLDHAPWAVASAVARWGRADVVVSVPAPSRPRTG